MPQTTPSTEQEKVLNLYGLGDFNTRQIKVFARDFELAQLSPKKFYDRRPDAAPEPAKYIQAMLPETAKYIVPDAFAGKTGQEVLKNMNLKQLEAIGISNDPILKMAIKNALNRILKAKESNPQVQALAQYLFYSPAWQF